MLNENRLYSISLGVASLQDGLVGVATALSPAMAGHFKFLLHHFFVRLGLSVTQSRVGNCSCTMWRVSWIRWICLAFPWKVGPRLLPVVAVVSEGYVPP